MADDKTKNEQLTQLNEAALARLGYHKVMGYPEAPFEQTQETKEQGIDLRDLWRVVRKRLWLILVIVVIVTIVVAIEAIRTKNIYQASAIVEVGKDNAMLFKSGELMIQNDDSDPQYLINVKTKMLMLQSRPLLEDVVVALKLDQDPRFAESGKRKLWDALSGSSFRPQNAEELALPLPEIDLPSGEESKRPPAESMRLRPFVEVLQNGLRVEPIRDTRGVKISFTHTNPIIAAMVANGVAQSFIERNFQTKTQKFHKTSDWLDSSTRALKARVEKAEQALVDYTRQNNIFSLEGNETLTSGKLAGLHAQVMRAEVDRILKQSLYEEVKQGRVAQLPEVFADPKIVALQKEYDDLSVRAVQLDLTYGPENPKVIEVRKQLAAISERINASTKALESKLKADYERALRDEQSLKLALSQAKGEAVQQNQAAIQYNILKKEVDTANSLYTEFLQKTSQARVEQAQQTNNIRLIEPAGVPLDPVGPRRLMTVALGLMLSLMAGIGLAFFLEYLDNTIKSVDDIHRYTQLPTLAVIPSISEFKGAKRGVAAKKSTGQLEAATGRLASFDGMLVQGRTEAAEAYRLLRTSILLSSAGGPPRTILVTSGQPADGKTTTIINMAISLSQLGASVLIVDCDLRRPATHKVFGVDQKLGLSSYLSGDVALEELIHQLPVPNLSLLPSGPLPPNPAELVSSERMKDLLKVLSSRYDYVLVDSPPVINVADSIILSTLVEGVILVVHSGKSTREAVRHVRNELTAVGARLIGVVLNDVDMKRDGYYNYYTYRYRYYTSAPEDEELSGSAG
jgi:capsular exopolysaccharide synthesis family protein